MPLDGPLFSAVSTSTQHLYLLLRCIGFASKALVQITAEGIRFSVEDGKVMQGLALLDKSLFENYIFNPRAANEFASQDIEMSQNDEEESANDCRFLVSLSAFLETLQILGLSDLSQNQPGKMDALSNAFSPASLMLNRSCTISYMQPGAPLCITLAEAGVTTTCELTTYEPDDWEDEGDADIPLQRDAIVFKTIMRSTWLHNAITELDATNPTILTFNASATEAPYFVLSCSGGPFSDSAVEFSVENDNAVRDERRRRKDARAAPAVSETFQVRPPEGATLVRQSYKFSLVRKALDAMAASSKVSIRCDEQGVMSLQFMIELGKSMHGKPDSGAVSSKISSAVSFVDFRFVPIIDDSDEEQSYADEP